MFSNFVMGSNDPLENTADNLYYVVAEAFFVGAMIPSAVLTLVMIKLSNSSLFSIQTPRTFSAQMYVISVCQQLSSRIGGKRYLISCFVRKDKKIELTRSKKT